MISCDIYYMKGLSPLEQEQKAVMAIGYAIASKTMDFSYRDARIAARSIKEAPSAFGWSREFQAMLNISEPLGIVWEYREDEIGTFIVTF